MKTKSPCIHPGLCDILWKKGKPYWKRDIKENERANICEPCYRKLQDRFGLESVENAVQIH